jgi:DNA-binding transcriptional LysR family regulator
MAPRGQVDLNSLEVFAAVAEAGGFTAAAERLGMAKAQVSIRVSRLEAQLGAALFARTTRQVTLTDAGQALFAECRPLLHSLHEAMEQVGTDKAELTGTLRLSSTVTHAVQALAPAVAKFAALHPKLQIELRSSDRVADLVSEGIDLAIRFGWLADSSLRAVRLGEFEQYVVASPEYLNRAGIPERPEDLERHEWVALTLLQTPLTWKFLSQQGDTHTAHVTARLRVDSAASLRTLLGQGAGISVMDQFSAQEDLKAGRLVRVLNDWSLARGGVYAVYPPGRYVPTKVRAFIDFYREHLPGVGLEK